MDRTKGIGASEVWKVYEAPMELYLSKVGVLEDPEENEAMWLGTNFEPVMDKRYLKETGFMPEPVEPIIHPAEPWRRCSPDRIVRKNGITVLLEYKTTGNHNDWGLAGSDEIPFRVGCQVQWQLSLMPEINQAEIPVYFFAPRREFAIYRVERNDEVIDNLVDAARDFWLNHVMKGIPPELDASDASKTLLNHLYPRDTEDLFAADADIERLSVNLKDLEEERDMVVKELTAIQNHLKNRIGDHAGVVTSLGKITWKRQKDSEVVDWKAAFDAAIAEFSYPGNPMADRIIQSKTTIRPGSRVFRPFWKKEEK